MSVASSTRLPSAPGGIIAASTVSVPVDISTRVSVSVPREELGQSRAVESGTVACQERSPVTARSCPAIRTATAALDRCPEMRRQVSVPQCTSRESAAMAILAGIETIARPSKIFDAARVLRKLTILMGYGLLHRGEMGSLT